MSSPSPVLVSGVATLATTTTQLPAGNAPQASVTVVVTDSANTTYPVVTLNGSESPPWSYAATFASGSATAVATAIDTSGNPIGSPVTLSFTVTPVVPQTFQAPSGFTFTAASASAAAAAVHRNASVKT
jgi:hypothetical protein